jgi:hypothetical protein
LHIDSMVALYCLESMSSKTLAFIPLLRAIAKILMRHDIRLKLTYISTTANVIADCLFRGGVGFGALLQTWYHQLPSLKRDFEDWMFHPVHFRSLDKQSGQCPSPRVRMLTAVIPTRAFFGCPLTVAWTTCGTTCWCGAIPRSP